jgi:probable F420-dependent oxidoreductase
VAGSQIARRLRRRDDAGVRVDLLCSGSTWTETARLARDAAAAGFSGLQFTETTQTPWMALATAAQAAPRLELSTGIAIAFARSPMVSASLAWELAGNTEGRFRLGLGSQVRAHVERRFAASYSPPGPRLRDYVLAVKACFAAFRGEAPLAHTGPYYRLSLLPEAWTPPRHPFGNIKVDVAAVGPWMCRMAGEVADGVHVHPFHSVDYLEHRFAPALTEGLAAAGRDRADLSVAVPVFAVAGETVEERAALLEQARAKIAFYGTTPNYAFQFDDLGFDGLAARLNSRLRARDIEGMTALITDEVLEHFAVVASWDELAAALISRYQGRADRIALYLTEQAIREEPSSMDRWGEVARFVAAS